MRRQCRRALQSLRERQVVEPGKRQPIVKPLELAGQFLSPELLQLGGTDDDEYAGRVREQEQHVVENLRHVHRAGDSGLVVAKVPVFQESRFHGRVEERRRGKEPFTVLMGEHGRRATHGYHQVELSSPQRRQQVVDDGLLRGGSDGGAWRLTRQFKKVDRHRRSPGQFGTGGYRCGT